MHIEQSMQDVHADIIGGSGLPEVLKISNLSITGTDAVININHLKRVRYLMQVTVCTIYKKLKEAYLNSKSTVPMMQWLNERSQENDMSFTWQLILNVEIQTLLFVRSQRESNFHLSITIMEVIYEILLRPQSLQLCKVGELLNVEMNTHSLIVIVSSISPDIYLNNIRSYNIPLIKKALLYIQTQSSIRGYHRGHLQQIFIFF